MDILAPAISVPVTVGIIVAVVRWMLSARDKAVEKRDDEIDKKLAHIEDLDKKILEIENQKASAAELREAKKELYAHIGEQMKNLEDRLERRLDKLETNLKEYIAQLRPRRRGDDDQN